MAMGGCGWWWGAEGSGAGAVSCRATRISSATSAAPCQEDQQRTRLSVLPTVLLLHFKHFKTATHLGWCPPPSFPDPFCVYRVVSAPLWIAGLSS